MEKILIAEPNNFSPKALELISKRFQVTERNISENELLWAFDNFECFWFRLAFKIDKEILHSKKRKVIKIICPVTGLNHIDTIECKKLGIDVISLKGEYVFLKEIRATAELTLALTLATLRKIPQSFESVKNFKWDRDDFKGNEIYNKKVGIIGYGRLGKIVAKYFQSFGATILVYDKKRINIKKYSVVKSLKELVARSDIITLHVDYNSASHSMMNASIFNNFKKGSIVINTSRGEIIDNSALLNSLNKGTIMGAALDVIDNEYSINDHELIQYSKNNANLIITPHIGGNTEESFKKTELFLAKKLLDSFEKE